MVFSSSQWWAATGGEAAYVPKGALWFDGAADYLSKTDYSGDSTRTKLTLSGWFKRGSLDANSSTFNAESGSDYWNMRYDSTNKDQLYFVNYISAADKGTMITTPVYRDPAAWQHIVLTWDTTPGTPTENNIYWTVNGVRVTALGTSTYPAQNTNSQWGNSSLPHWIGRNGAGNYFNGYMSELIYLDGYARPASDFGTEDSNGVWIPKDPTTSVAAYKGTNGFWLDFADTTSTTTIGYDVSGNSNHFSTSGIASGTSNWTYDRPADSGEDTGNFCTLSPIEPRYYMRTASLYSGLKNGNLVFDNTTTGSGGGPRTTIELPTTGKWKFECAIVCSGTSQPEMGVATGYTNSDRGAGGSTAYYGYQAKVVVDDAYVSGAGDTWGDGDTCTILLDMDSGSYGEVTYKVNNVTQTGAYSLTERDGPAFFYLYDQSGNNEFTCNFGATAFAYTDTGYLGLASQNLPEVTVTKPTDNFLPILYQGNGEGQRVGNFIPFTDSYTVNYSAQVNGSDEYLNITPSGAGSSTTTATVSCWVKRNKIGVQQYILFAGRNSTPAEGFSLNFDSSDRLNFAIHNGSSYVLEKLSTRTFQDTSAWMNICAVYNTATGDNKFYVNGVEITIWTTNTNASASEDIYLNSAQPHRALAGSSGGSVAFYNDTYIAEFVCIDGTAYTASDFGQTDTSTNRWIPKDVSGLNFGTNGWYLNMADKNDLGDDESGNGNDWTENNMDATNGSNQMYDTPTRNFSTLSASYGYNIDADDLSEGNLKFTSVGAAGSPGGQRTSGSTMRNLSSGKYYFEISLAGSFASTGESVGIVNQDFDPFATTQTTGSTDAYTLQFGHSGDYYQLRGATGTITSAITSASTDIVLCAVDLDNRQLWFGYKKAGAALQWFTNSMGVTGTFSSTSPTISSLGGTSFTIIGDIWYGSAANTGINTYNFGQWVYLNNVYGANVCEPGMTVTANSGGTNLSNIVDGDLTTSGSNANGSTGWIQIDLGAANGKAVTLIWIDFKQDNQEISTFKIEGSDSATMASGVFDFYPDQSVSWSSGEDVTFTNSTNTTAYRYWRFSKTGGGSGNNLNIYEIEMHENAATSTTLDSDAGGYFVTTPPTDFIALNQDNLTANTAGITGLSWLKSIETTDFHIWFDRARGIYNYLRSSHVSGGSTTTPYANQVADTSGVQRFLQQGVQVGNMNEVNTSAESYMLWNWANDGAATANSDGTVTGGSTVRVNSDAGFSIVTFTGQSAAITVGHGLGVKPDFIVLKGYVRPSGSTAGWYVYNSGVGATKTLWLSLADAAYDWEYWGDVEPTTSVFSVGWGTGNTGMNQSGDSYIAYCWASVEGYSRFGTYTGNGADDGAFVYTGFKPNFLLIKRVDNANYWVLFDGARSPYNPVTATFPSNYDNAGSASGLASVDFVSNGFKWRLGAGGSYPTTNYDGGTYTYAAFAEHPFGGSGIGQGKAS